MRRDALDVEAPRWVDYRASLRANLPFNSLLNRRILDEISDHLAEATSHWLEEGLPRHEAERRAIEQLGPADQVATAFARSRGLGMATTTTKLSGLAGALAPVAFLLGILLLNYDGAGDPGHWVGGGIAFGSLGMLVFFMYGLWKRHAGSLGMWGKAALFLAAASPVLSLPFAWGAPLAMVGYLAISFMLLGIGIWRAGMLPRAPMALCALGPIMLLGAGLIGRMVGFDGALYFAFGLIPTTAGLVWLGLVLWNERGEDLGGTDLPAMA